MADLAGNSGLYLYCWSRGSTARAMQDQLHPAR